MWKVFSEEFLNANRIFPTQQRDVKKLIDVCKLDSNIKRIVIFGSSVTSLCNPWSDIDVYLELENDLRLPRINNPDAIYDKWTNFTVDERLMDEITKTGVVVYER